MHMYLCAPWMQQPLKGQLMKVKSVSLSIGLKSNSMQIGFCVMPFLLG